MPSKALLACAFGALLFTNAARATIGLAEWSVSTPGAHLVCSQDPFKAEHGVCLRTSDKSGQGEVGRVWVSKIQWWQYYKGAVAGECARGHFLFEEKSHQLSYVPTEVALKSLIKGLPAPKPLTRRITPEDGWKLANGPFLRALIEQRRRSPEFKQLSKAQQSALDHEAQRLNPPDLRPLPE